MRWRDVGFDEAESLVRDGVVRVLDVRTPGEYEALGHLPGALLLPMDLLACAPATLADVDEPLLVCCQHGVRSQTAVRWLAEAGLPRLLNLRGGLAHWRGALERGPAPPEARPWPSAWLLENADLLSDGAHVLDVACGRGRNALLLATAGFPVKAVDREAPLVDRLRAVADGVRLSLDASVLDLEAGEVDLGEEAFDVALVFNYLHRPLFPALVRALRPGGLLLCETFTKEQAERGHPKNPAFLLERGELERLVAPLEVVRRREGERDGRMVSAVAARKR